MKIQKLDQREQLLLHYRYDLSMKQEEIARKLNISQVQVSRLVKKDYQEAEGASGSCLMHFL